MENISFNQTCQSNSALYQACADGVPYLVLVKDGCCDDNVLKYINMEDGSLTTTRPTNLVMGACDEAVSGNSNVCFEFTVNNAVVSIRVATVNGVVTYYENDVEVTNSTRISEIDALIEGATADNVVCCPNCQTIPDGQVCYEITTTKTYQAAEAFDIENGTPGVPEYIAKIYLRNIATDTMMQEINFSPALQVWNGTSRISTAALTTALTNAGYLTKWQLADPRIDRFEVQNDGNITHVYVFDEADAYTNANRIANHGVDFSLSSTGSPISFGQQFGTYTNVTSTSVSSYKTVTANGITDYYKDDVLLTNATDIEAAQTAILTALPENVICCPDCGGGGGGTLTNTLTAGHDIGTYTDGDGNVTTIRETVTSVETNSDGSFTFTNEEGTETIIPVTPCKSFYEKQTFTATAGQTTFTLLTAPSGDIHFSRNGSTLHDLAAAVSGTTVTYVPAQNNNEPLLANDRIDISYVYTICTGTATVVDGSETKVTAGTNTTVTGTGTIADPYVVSATGGSTAGIGNYAVLSNLSGQALSTGVTIDWQSINDSYGSLVVADPGTNTLLLKAGYIYEIETEMQMQFANSGSFMNYGIYRGTTAASQTTAVGTKGKIRPNTETFANGMFDIPAQGFVVATTDTYVSLKVDNGNGTTQNYEGATFFKAKVIGKI
jgi:hypothetical protein